MSNMYGQKFCPFVCVPMHAFVHLSVVTPISP